MDEVRLVCPHCGLPMKVLVEGKKSSLMVFVCARCNSPLMRFEGEVFELDRTEFSAIRKKLSPVISQLQNEAESRPSISDELMRELAENLENCKDVSDFIDKI